MKRLAPSLILVALALAAVAYLLLVERERPSDAERALRAQSVLPVFRPEELTRIALDRPGDDLLLVKTKEWSMVSPQPGAADTAAVETLVGSLASASTVRIASAATPSGNLGETRAHLALTFVSGNVTTHASLTLRGPASTPAGAGYVTRDDGTTAVASADLVTLLLAPSDRFRDRVVAPYPLTRIDRLVETVPGAATPVLTLTRSGTDTFRLADGRRAARATTDALGVALADLRVETFLPGSAAAKIAEAPSRIIELDPPQGEPRAVLRFGGACPGHAEETTVSLDAPAPFVGCVPTSALAALSPADDALIERHLFQAKVDEVSALLLRTPEGQLDLARKGAGWHERAPVSRDLDPGESDAATELLEQLVAAQGTPRPLAPPPAPPATSDRLVTLRAGDPPTDEVVAWSPAGAGAETPELTLSPEVRALLEPTSRTLKPLPLWSPPLDPAQVASVDRVDLDCPGHEQILTHRENGWWLGEPPSVMADQAGTIDLVDAVVHARARRWIDHAAISPSGCRGVALGTHGRPLACLSFAAPAPSDGGVVAEVRQGVDGAPSYALVDPALADRVCRLYVDRHGFALPADVASVTLVRGGRRVALSVEAADASDLAAAAFATLNDLVADDVVHQGAPRPDDHLDPPELEVEIRDAKNVLTTIRFGAVIGGARRGVSTGDGAARAVFAFDAARLDPVFRAAAR